MRNDIADESLRSEVQQQGGRDAALGVQRIEQAQIRARQVLRGFQHGFGTGVELAHVGLERRAAHELRPQTAMAGREFAPDNHAERESLKNVAQASGYGGVGREGVEDVLFQREGALPHGGGQKRGHGETVFRSAGVQRLVQRGGKIPRIGVEVVAGGQPQTIAHRHEPVRPGGTGHAVPREKKKIINEQRLAAGHDLHEQGRVFGDGGERKGARKVGRECVGHGGAPGAG